MDDQQSLDAGTDLHAGAQPQDDCEGRDSARVQGRRNRTARIKPSTRYAVLDQLAAIADGIIRERELVWAARDVMNAAESVLSDFKTSQPRRWWQVWK